MSDDTKKSENGLRKLMSSREPMTKERALESLALMAASGRVSKPSSGGPPPSLPTYDRNAVVSGDDGA